MNIKFIGTGSMISCDNQACYLINDHIMIDMPNGTTKILKRNKLIDKIDYIFITHMHGDHFFDLPFIFLDHFKTQKNLYVVIEKKCKKKVLSLLKLAFPYSFYEIMASGYIHLVSNDKKVKIDNIDIERFKVKHGILKYAYGYIINTSKNKVIFTGDTSYCQSLKEVLFDANYLICDSTNMEGNIKHMGVDNIKSILEKYPKLNVIPSHMGINAKKAYKKMKLKNLLLKEDLEDLTIE